MIGAKVVIAIASGLCLGWAANGLRLEARLADLRAAHAQRLEQLAALQAEAIAEQIRIRDQLQRQLAAIDQQRYQELTHAQETADRLAAELRGAERRLSVRTASACSSGVPAAADAASLGDGGDRAELHPETAAALVRVAGDADQCAVRLAALQDWARKVAGGKAPRPD